MLATVETWFLFFLLYSFAGWVYESILCSFMQRELVNRGFLHGPICPIYGTGAVVVLLLLSPLKGNPLLLFLLSAVTTTTIEYLTAYLLEKLFHLKLWDYSINFLNLHGRVCLLSFVAFGVMCTLMVEFIHPWIATKPAELLTPLGMHVISAALLLALLVDLAITLWSVMQLTQRLRELHRALGDKLGELPIIRSRTVRRLLSAFPKWDFMRYREEWERIKQKTYL